MPDSGTPSAGPSKRPALAALCLLLSATAVGAQADPNQPADKRPVSEQVMAQLRAAGEARAQRLKETQQWALEKQKLELLKATVARESRRHRAAAAEARQTETKLRARLEQHQARQQRLKAVEGVVDAICERLEKALDELAAKSLPGLVPPDRAAGITEPGRRLAAGVDRLRQVRRRTTQAAVEVVGASLDGQAVAVKILRAGGVAAWWLSLDGKKAGTAVVRDGQTILSAAADLQDTQAIRKAFAIAEGRGTPDWALLPVQTKPAEE